MSWLDVINLTDDTESVNKGYLTSTVHEYGATIINLFINNQQSGLYKIYYYFINER